MQTIREEYRNHSWKTMLHLNIGLYLNLGTVRFRTADIIRSSWSQFGEACERPQR